MDSEVIAKKLIKVIGGILLAGFAFIFVSFAFPIILLSMMDTSGDIGDISTAAISPTGEYQAEAVNISYGATGGESSIFVEVAGKEPFPAEDGKNTKKAIKIKEIKYGWATEFEIEWIEDNAFKVIVGDTAYKVEMDGKKYTVTQ
jgi:hypothetical protein